MAKETKSGKSASGGKKKTEKKAPAQPTSRPLIDPLQSAAAAAAIVGHKIAPVVPSSGAKTESSTFRNLKDSLSRPHSQTIGGVLDKIAPGSQKSFGTHAGTGKQVGQNQTFGADVARKNVPRRTNG